jgi:hypothetical protein
MLEQDDIGKKLFLSYLAAMFVCGALALGIAWIYASTQGIRFLESGYSVWNAKGTLLRDCDLGAVAVFGDSRADSAVIPARFSKTATNFGFAGGTPIENYFFVKSLMSCNAKPRMLVLSFNPNAFEIIQPWLWDNAVRYGALGWNEISLIRHEAQRLNDQSYFAVKPHIGVDGLFRDLAYSSHFPAIYFNSLVESRLLFREEKNRAKFAEVIHARGYPSYGNGGQIGAAGVDAADTPFAPLPLQKSFFEKTVAMLDRAGIETYFMITPHSETGAHAHDTRYKEAYLAYLRGMAAQYRHFHLLQQQVPIWPDAMFADGQHLNGHGADAFSRQLNRCVEAAGTQTDSQTACDMAWIGQPMHTADVTPSGKVAP